MYKKSVVVFKVYKTPATETYCTDVKPFIIHRQSFLIMRSGIPPVAIDCLLKMFLKFVGFNVHVFTRSVKFTSCELFQLIKPYLFPDCGTKAKKSAGGTDDVFCRMFAQQQNLLVVHELYQIQFDSMDKLKIDFDSVIVNCPRMDKLKISFDSMIVNCPRMDKLKISFDSMIVNCPRVDKLKISFDSMIVNCPRMDKLKI